MISPFLRCVVLMARNLFAFDRERRRRVQAGRVSVGHVVAGASSSQDTVWGIHFSELGVYFSPHTKHTCLNLFVRSLFVGWHRRDAPVALWRPVGPCMVHTGLQQRGWLPNESSHHCGYSEMRGKATSNRDVTA